MDVKYIVGIFFKGKNFLKISCKTFTSLTIQYTKYFKNFYDYLIENFAKIKKYLTFFTYKDITTYN